MIHLCEINPTDTRKEVGKRARRYAMTGGVELALADTLTSADLVTIAEEWIPGLEPYTPATSAYRSCHAYRILSMIVAHPACATGLREKLFTLLDKGGLREGTHKIS